MFTIVEKVNRKYAKNWKVKDISEKYKQNFSENPWARNVKVLFVSVQALWWSVTDIVQPIREIVWHKEETTGRPIWFKPPDILSEVYCLSDQCVLVSDRTVALSNVT
jgi:hypothetical protein